MLTKKIYLSFFLIIFLTTGTLRAQWSELGGKSALGLNGSIYSICSDVGGNIYAAGHLMDNTTNHVCQWNGVNWIDLPGLNPNGVVMSICPGGFGIYAAGYFTNASFKKYVAYWNGFSWSELGGLNGLNANGEILSICTTAGNVYAAGNFTNASGKRYVARYNGTSWTELGGLNALMSNALIRTICSDASGNIYAHGSFSSVSGNFSIAKWDGSNWSNMGSNSLPSGTIVQNIYSRAGNIYVSCNSTFPGTPSFVLKWNGLTWIAVGNLTSLNSAGTVNSDYRIYSLIADANENLYIAGGPANGKFFVARWDGYSWSELAGFDSLSSYRDISTLCIDPAKNIYAGGAFINAAGYSYVAKYNSSAAIKIAVTSGSASSCIGEIVTFTATIANGGANPIYQWQVNGVNVGTDTSVYSSNSLISGQTVRCILTSNLLGVSGSPATSNSIVATVNSPYPPSVSIYTPSPALYPGVMASFTATPKNGGTNPVYQWQVDGINVGTNSPKFNSTNLTNGQSITCKITSNSTCATSTTAISTPITISVYNPIWKEVKGTNSLPVNGNTYLSSFCMDTTGNLYVASSNGNVFKWNGISWSVVGSLAANNSIRTIHIDPAGNLYAAGDFTNSSGNHYVAKWNGSSWSELVGINSLAANGSIYSLCSDSLGNIYASGSFTEANGVNSFIAKWSGGAWHSEGITNLLGAGNLCLYKGKILAAFDGAVKYWESFNWVELGGTNALGTNISNGPISTDAFGNLFAAVYDHSTNKSFVSKWNGNSWSQLGGVNPFIASGHLISLCCDPAGNIYAAGEFLNTAGKYYVAKWDGTSWSELGGLNSLAANGIIQDLQVDLNGNILACGRFSTGASPVQGNKYVAKYGVANAAVAIQITSGSNPSCQGTNLTFTALPTNGGASPTYQWKVNGINVGTNSSVFNSSSLLNGQVVTCSMTASLAGVPGNPATSNSIPILLNPLPAATITSPVSNICAGNSTSLSANIGTGLSYQWKLNGLAIIGATAASYTASATGSYTCLVSNSCGSISSNAILINAVTMPLTSITANGPTSFCKGGSVTLSTPHAIGNTYQWKSNGKVIYGATASTFVATASGNYKCTVANACGTITTSIILVSVNATLSNITASGATTFCGGGSVTLSASPAAGQTYQWKLDGTSIAGATGVSHTASVTGNYKCVISGTCGIVTSNIIKVLAGPPSKPSSISGDASVCANSAAVYSVGSVSTATSYLWSAPVGATITAGQGSIAATVKFGTASGTISCAAINVCGTGVAKTLAIAMPCRLGVVNEIDDTAKLTVFPNPFTDKTTIQFALLENESVQLSLVDFTGKEVVTLYEGNAEGEQMKVLIFDGSAYPKGMYFVRLKKAVGETWKKLIRID